MRLLTIAFATARYGGVPVKMFANVPKLTHVVATLYDRVDMRNKVEV